MQENKSYLQQASNFQQQQWENNVKEKTNRKLGSKTNSPDEKPKQ